MQSVGQSGEQLVVRQEEQQQVPQGVLQGALPGHQQAERQEGQQAVVRVEQALGLDADGLGTPASRISTRLAGRPPRVCQWAASIWGCLTERPGGRSDPGR